MESSHKRIIFIAPVFYIGAFFINWSVTVSKQFTLGKNERLKSRKAIEQLFKDGQRFTITPFRIFYAMAPASELQAGVGAGTRNFKKATDRNRIKRLTREAWRLQKKPLQEKLQQLEKGLHIFFIYTGKELPTYNQVYESVEKSLQKLNDLIEA